MQPLSRLRQTSWLAENFLAVPLVAGISAFAVYWAVVIDRIPPVSISNGTVLPQQVKRGEVITTSWDWAITRKGQCSATISRLVIDSQKTAHRRDDDKVDNVLIDTPRMSGGVNVPFAASWGPAYYRSLPCYRCDGLSLTRVFPICVQRPDLPFMIVPE